MGTVFDDRLRAASQHEMQMCKNKEPGHYSGLFNNNTLNLSAGTLLPTENIITESGVSACHQMWLQGKKKRGIVVFYKRFKFDTSG